MAIEAVFWRHFQPRFETFETLEKARGFLEEGEGHGTLSSVGVFDDGEPAWSVHEDREPKGEETNDLRRQYQEMRAAKSRSRRF